MARAHDARPLEREAFFFGKDFPEVLTKPSGLDNIRLSSLREPEMPTMKCHECGKRVSQLNSRYAKNPAAKSVDYDRGQLPGENVYGPDCHAKLIALGTIVEREEGGYKVI